MIITKCSRKCCYVNLIGFCCLDDGNSKKHTVANCNRGMRLAGAKTSKEAEAIRLSPRES